ncbi:hypothetical protein [Chitinivorax sp. B]|uniref:hypothetical protein n=1 Tax=Chitinivorax sp. B TaxID=2502235 RepID=UPI0010FA0BCF|nr:hypothetical protein [Chitinivorax sp. B]
MSLQFHALPSEITSVLKEVVLEGNVFISILHSQPFSVEIIDDIDDACRRLLSLSNEKNVRCALSTRKIAPESSLNRFLDLNDGCIVLDVGKVSDVQLNESAVLFMSDNVDGERVAKNFSKRIKKITKSGVLAINPITKAKSVNKSHRYTDGAKRLFDSGVKIAPVAGIVELALIDI